MTARAADASEPGARFRLAPATGLALMAAGFLVALAESTFVAWRYDLAFAGPLDRVLFVAAHAAGAGFLAGIVGLVWGGLVALLLRGRSLAAVLALVPLWLGLTLSGLFLLRTFALDLSRSVAGIAVMVGIGLLAALLCLPFLPGLHRATERRAPGRGFALWAVVLLAVAVATPLTARVTRGTLPGDAEAAPWDGANAGPARLPDGTNVLLILVDTLRADHLTHAGYTRDTTPFLDRLAADGIRFSQTITQATRTSPNMASLLTGVTPYAHGIIRASTILDQGLLTWGEILDGAGYRNVGIVTNPNVGVRYQFNQGMDEFDEQMLATVDVMVDRAIAWLAEPREEPFFMWLHLIDPHNPYDPPDPYDSMYEGDPVYAGAEERNLGWGDSTSHGGIHKVARVRDLTDLRDYVARYDGEIRFSEDHLARLRTALEETGLWDDTLVIFTSDHGESLGEHDYYFAHGTYVFDATAHVPFLMRHAALPAGLVVPDLVRTIDILPTVLDLLGLPIPPTVEGESLMPLVNGEAPGPGVAPICSGTGGYVTLAARTETLKLVLTPRRWRRFDQVAETQLRLWPNRYRRIAYRHRAYDRALYDLEADPGEVTPVEGRSEDRAELEELIGGWIDAADSQFEAARPSEDELDPETVRRLKSLGYLQ